MLTSPKIALFAKFDDASGGGSAGVLGSNPADLLESDKLGVHMCGVVLGVDEPKLFSGTSKSGKPYAFTQRRIQLFTGNKSVEVSERLPDAVNGQAPPVFAPLAKLTMQTFKVISIRPNGLNVNFDVAIA